ncbi:MAG: hypothetical protein NZ480_08225 [Bdellovibrionaceae bacterium]|nr:hypothetical protein [Pseudobdellovibrionaceae bacterium]MDW8190450.1 hypothetical protein [Pseudobdellovibrionaceae bacterium]
MGHRQSLLRSHQQGGINSIVSDGMGIPLGVLAQARSSLRKRVLPLVGFLFFLMLTHVDGFAGEGEYFLEINRGIGQHHSDLGDTYGIELEKHLSDSHLVVGLFYDYEVFRSKGADHYQHLMGTQMAYITDNHLKFTLGIGGAAQMVSQTTYFLTRASFGYQYLIDQKKDVYLCPSVALDYFNNEAEYAAMLGVLFHL